MASMVKRIPKLFRLLAGRGCCAADFGPVYSRVAEDAWHYAENPFEKMRFDAIMNVIVGLSADKALEVGCAEGHLTRRLAGRVNQLVACDIVDEAIERARRHCQGLQNVQFLNMDIRVGWPDETFDLLIYSDVLYYFSKPEVRRAIQDSAEHVCDGGHLLFANEWHDHYRWKPTPTFIMRQLCRSAFWQLVLERHYQDVDSRRSITIALFRRVASEATGCGQTEGIQGSDANSLHS